MVAGSFGVSIRSGNYINLKVCLLKARLRAMSGADGDESREDKNERILNDKFVDLFEE